MGELSIKIKLGDREYPMRVNAEEEESIRRAGKLLNDKIRSYKEKFGIDDRQDLFAMVAFDCMIDQIQQQTSHEQQNHFLQQKINSLNNLINDAL